MTLELDKQNALEMQQMSRQIYRGQKQGQTRTWTLSSPKAIEAKHGGLIMEKAPGITAVKLRDRNVELYKEAMGIVLEVEFNAFMGIVEPGSAKPQSFFANPDLHDGQVLIDMEKNIISVLDFGQAVAISNTEREQAIRFLLALELSSGENADTKSSLKLLNELRQRWSPGSQTITETDLSALQLSNDRMDRFIKVLGLFGQTQVKTPLPVIQWILGLNRLVSLSHHIDKPIDGKIRGLLRADYLGIPLEYHNRWRRIVEDISRIASICLNYLTP